MIKAVFFDIDGTLISFKSHKIPASALEAISRIKDKGIKIFLCTSRAKQFLANIPSIGYDGIVCLTGSHCIDIQFNDINCIRMDSGDVAAAVTYAQKRSAPIVGISSTCLYADKTDNPAFLNLLATGGLKPEDVTGGVAPFPDFLSAQNPVALAESLGIMQIICFFSPGEEEELAMSHMPHSHTQRWTDAFVDIISKSTSKAIGLDVMGKHFGFTREETMAFGDGANDIPMIQYAGIGVAMGNAAQNVKDAADYITDDVDEDGLAHALEHLIK